MKTCFHSIPLPVGSHLLSPGPQITLMFLQATLKPHLLISIFPGDASPRMASLLLLVSIKFTPRKIPLEESMATHSSILARRIPWIEEPGGLQSTGSQRVGHDWSDLAHAHTHTHTQTHTHTLWCHLENFSQSYQPLWIFLSSEPDSCYYFWITYFGFCIITKHLNKEGNGTPLQYSCLESPMDGGDW